MRSDFFPLDFGRVHDHPRRHLPLPRDVISVPRRAAEHALEQLKDGQRAFLERARLALAQRMSRDATLTDLARASGTNHSTLTKFVNQPGKAGPLKPLTIMRIEEATGVTAAPELRGGSRPKMYEEGEEPLERPDPELEAALQGLVAGRNNVLQFVLRSRAVEAAGYREGDVVLLDQSLEPKSGDVVCARVFSAEGGSRNIWRVYSPPFLLVDTYDQALKLERPRVVDGTDVLIRGVVTDMIRRRRA